MSDIWFDRLMVVTLTIWALHGVRATTAVESTWGKCFLAVGMLWAAVCIWPSAPPEARP